MHWSLWVLLVWLFSIGSFFGGVWVRHQKAVNTEKFLRDSLHVQRTMIAAHTDTIKNLKGTDRQEEFEEFIAQKLAEAQAKQTLWADSKMYEEAKFQQGVRHGLHMILFKIQGRL